MKKLIIIGMLIFGLVAMAEKLTTDGKDHLKELLGKWGEPQPVYIVMKNNKLYYVDEEKVYNPVTKVNNYTFVINWVQDDETLKRNPQLKGFKTCFAWDVKYKKLAFLKKCGNYTVDQYIPRKEATFGG